MIILLHSDSVDRWTSLALLRGKEVQYLFYTGGTQVWIKQKKQCLKVMLQEIHGWALILGFSILILS